MPRHKGMMSNLERDKLFPYQVAVVDTVMRERFGDMLKYEHSPTGATVYHEGHWYSVQCFSLLERALAFKAEFAGIWCHPKDRGKGAKWSHWNRPDRDLPPGS